MGILKDINFKIEVAEGTLKEIQTIKDETFKNNEFRRADWNLFIRILNNIKKDLT